MLIRTITYIMLALSFTAKAGAETYPKGPVTIIVPFSAGGSVDIVARSVAQALQEKLRQPFVVESRPGASAKVRRAMTQRIRLAITDPREKQRAIARGCQRNRGTATLSQHRRQVCGHMFSCES